MNVLEIRKLVMKKISGRLNNGQKFEIKKIKPMISFCGGHNSMIQEKLFYKVLINNKCTGKYRTITECKDFLLFKELDIRRSRILAEFEKKYSCEYIESYLFEKTKI